MSPFTTVLDSCIQSPLALPEHPFQARVPPPGGGRLVIPGHQCVDPVLDLFRENPFPMGDNFASRFLMYGLSVRTAEDWQPPVWYHSFAVWGQTE